MAKLKLVPDPTFKAKVPIRVAGAGEIEVEFTFKYRDRDQLQAFFKPLQKPGAVFDADLVTAMCTGWDLLETFNAENVETLCRQYIQAPRAIFEVYGAELTGARAKN